MAESFASLRKKRDIMLNISINSLNAFCSPYQQFTISLIFQLHIAGANQSSLNFCGNDDCRNFQRDNTVS